MAEELLDFPRTDSLFRDVSAEDAARVAWDEETTATTFETAEGDAQ